MTSLAHKIKKEEEKEVCLETTDIFRPRLKQINNSIWKTKSAFTEKEGISFVPTRLRSSLMEVKQLLLKLVNENGLLTWPNIVDDALFPRTSDHGLVFLVESFVLALDICITQIPQNLKCDVVIALAHQPVILLTLITEDEVTSEDRAYNAKVATSITTALRKFSGEFLNIIHGVVSKTEQMEIRSLEDRVKKLAKNCHQAFPTRSFAMDNYKHDKVLTAFWAAISETTVFLHTGEIECEYLRFLTSDQCVALVQNINEDKVTVTCHPGCGATTLMLEVARRLSRLDLTLLVCSSKTERDTLRSIHAETISYDDIAKTNLTKYRHIVYDGSNNLSNLTGRLWHFIYVSRPGQTQPLNKRVLSLETENYNRQKLIDVLTSHDRRHKLDHLIMELDTVKLCDTKLKLKKSLSDTTLACKGQSAILKSALLSDESYDSFKTERGLQQKMGEELRRELQKRTCIFPILRNAVAEDKKRLIYLTAKTDVLERVLLDHMDSNFRDETLFTEEHLVTDEGVVSQPFVEETNYDNDQQLNAKLERLKRERTEQEEDLKKYTLDECDEWQHKMDLLSVEMRKMYSHAMITDVIGEDNLPMYSEDFHPPGHVTDTFSRYHEPSCLSKQLMQFQYGNLSSRNIYQHLTKMVAHDEQTLSVMNAKCNQLELVHGCPVYIVGELESPFSSPLSCPPMKFDKGMANTDWCHVTADNELINFRSKQIQDHTNRFRRFLGTCISPQIPRQFDPSMSILTRYWETDTQLRFEPKVSCSWPVLEMGLIQEQRLDNDTFCSQKPGSWAVRVVFCTSHQQGVCTQVFGEGTQVGGCQTRTVFRERGIASFKYGVLMDRGRKRVSFIDLDRSSVLHKFQVDLTQQLRFVFAVYPYIRHCSLKTKLVSGDEIKMTDSKRALIYKALC